MTAILPTPSSLDNNTLLKSMLDNPIEFSKGIHRQNVNLLQNKMKVVQPGPPSPPRGSRQLVNGFNKVSKSQEKEEGEEEDDLESRDVSDDEEEGDTRMVNGKTKLSNGTTTQKQSMLPTPNPTQPPSSSSTTISPKKQSLPPPSTYRPPINPDDLYKSHIELSWPAPISTIKRPAAGLNNPSMACYANATLQVLLHTPPVLRIAMEHEEGKCIRAGSNRFCMLCQLRNMAEGSHWSGRRAYAPQIHSQLREIKKGFSKSKQEDTHEFFRFVTDALQLTALAGTKKDLPEKIKHSTWVYKVWGGRVRSRVICSRCQKPSDTFDWFLDLSLDVNRSGTKSIKNMMNGFTREDKLEGDNKYHCDNCKAKANATKSFKIQEAPPILTLHLKRFSVDYHSYSGRARANKYNGQINYEEYLDIAPYMVDPKVGGTKYRLFGVTCHRGVELRFGHYTSYVRGPQGRWFHADDDDVSPATSREALDDRTAYLLSYIRVPDNEAIPTSNTPQSSTKKVNGSDSTNGHVPSPLSTKVGDKRARSDNDEEEEEGQINMLKPKRSANGLIGPVKPMSIRKGTPPRSRPASPSQNQEDLEVELPPELPASSRKFGSLMTPKSNNSPSKGSASTPNTPSSGSKIIHQPRPIPPGQFYGTKSPIARPHNPRPDSDGDEDEDSQSLRNPKSKSDSFRSGTADSYRGKKMSKKEKKALRRKNRQSHRPAGDNPFKAAHMGGGGGASNMRKSKFANMKRKALH